MSDNNNNNNSSSSGKKLAKEWYKNLKAESECLWCGEDHPATLEFHHRNPEEKVMSVASMVHKGLPLKDIFNEVAKCDILCSNCHRIWHYEERQGQLGLPKFPDKKRKI